MRNGKQKTARKWAERCQGVAFILVIAGATCADNAPIITAVAVAIAGLAVIIAEKLNG